MFFGFRRLGFAAHPHAGLGWSRSVVAFGDGLFGTRFGACDPECTGQASYISMGAANFTGCGRAVGCALAFGLAATAWHIGFVALALWAYATMVFRRQEQSKRKPGAQEPAQAVT